MADFERLERCNFCKRAVRWVDTTEGKRHIVNARMVRVLVPVPVTQGNSTNFQYQVVTGYISHYDVCPVKLEEKRRKDNAAVRNSQEG